MLRSLVATLALGFAGVASAATINTVLADLTSKVVVNATAEGMSFKPGDTAAYALTVGSFINGTMTLTVASVDASTLVINQDADLGFAGKQSCVETLNPNTGALIKMVCNGQEQTPGDQGTQTVEQEKEDTVTVPAGTFDCLYIKVKSSKDNSESELWSAPKKVPVFGLVQMNAPSQMGTMTVKLTSFKN